MVNSINSLKEKIGLSHKSKQIKILIFLYNANVPGQLVGITHQHWAPRPYKEAMVDGGCW